MCEFVRTEYSEACSMFCRFIANLKSEHKVSYKQMARY